MDNNESLFNNFIVKSSVIFIFMSGIFKSPLQESPFEGHSYK